MRHTLSNRRDFVKTAGSALGLLPLAALVDIPIQEQDREIHRKIVCVGGHPDDPESGCGGTLAKFVKAGYQVTIVYLTTGEAGIPNKTHDEAAAIRKQEAIEACKILQAKPVFAGQIDGATLIDNAWVEKMQAIIETEKPDIVFTHWPIDSHKDHQIASLLVIQTWVRAQEKFLLYFFEVCAGEQTMGFHPTDIVDISDTREEKRQAVYCHVSQDPPGIYACGHTSMEDFRGRVLGVQAGEGFVRMIGKGEGGLRP
jgi:LmbE family N-acetylglucosaminyl deacetylase